MADLSPHIYKLPIETLGQVFHCLDDIDDVLHFARCCKLMNSVFEFPGFRLAVFRSIITHSPQHEYDIVLSQNIAFYGAFSDEFYETSHAAEDRRSGRGNQLASKFLSPLGRHDKIGSEIIWDVVCRWQGMRLLFDLYCDSAIEAASFATPFSPDLRTNVSSNEAIEANFSRDLPPTPSGLLSSAANESTTRERRQAYRRFYKALITHWLAVETTWRAVTHAHNKVDDFGTAINTVRARWRDDLTGSLPDKLDVITVVDFVWDFLGRSLSKSRTYFPERDPRERQDEDPVRGLEFYSLNTLLCARPPNIVELLLATLDSSRWRFDHLRFLRRLGFFDAKIRIYLMQQGISDTMQTNTWLAMTFVERRVEERNELKWDARESTGMWLHYRLAQGHVDARTKALFQNPILETCRKDLGCSHFQGSR